MFFIAYIICGTYLSFFVLNIYDVCAYFPTEQHIVPVYLAGTLVPVTMLFEPTSEAQFGPAPSALLEFKDLPKNQTKAEIKKIGNKRGIYGFVNSVNGKLYIGSTDKLAERALQHISGNKSNIKLQRAIKNMDYTYLIFFCFLIIPKGHWRT